MKRSHGIPAWVEVATSPFTPNRNTDFAEDASFRHVTLPEDVLEQIYRIYRSIFYIRAARAPLSRRLIKKSQAAAGVAQFSERSSRQGLGR
jgi:hypothetical protein